MACVACGPGATKPYPTAEQAVRGHIEAAKAGDVSGLRRDSCGGLADAMRQHTDAEVRDEFRHAYDMGPDDLAAEATASRGPAPRQNVTGYYTHATDLEILFVTEDHDGWKVCEIHRGNGPFGRLPGPFERR